MHTHKHNAEVVESLRTHQRSCPKPRETSAAPWQNLVLLGQPCVAMATQNVHTQSIAQHAAQKHSVQSIKTNIDKHKVLCHAHGSHHPASKSRVWTAGWHLQRTQKTCMQDTKRNNNKSTRMTARLILSAHCCADVGQAGAAPAVSQR